MFSSGPNYTKLKTHLRLTINRLKLLEKKKTELAQKARKEIADYLAAGKIERAKIRVEHIIREDYMVEAMELLEMYCDLLLARFGLIQQMKNLDEGLAEAISTIIWAAPRIQTDVQEIKVIADILTSKYGKQYTEACREEAVQTISEKLKHKMSVQSPSKLLVEKYLIEIAKNYNVEYEPDPQNSEKGTIGFVTPTTLENKDQNVPYNPSNVLYNIPLDNSNGNKSENNQQSPLYESFPPDLNKQSDQKPKPQPRSKMPMNDFQLPDLPTVPSENNLPSNNPSTSEDIDFDDLMKRFEDLKKRK
ncbi:IST1 homolog isoform X4 [Apis mellifera]|uniref:IST1 homolog n=1 Tax=Apis mellifera TaxID=7460 RepID=A0A7M7H163_APIME|nr:IST1 homolog isoform X4 [Apis mellifera]|eukprot:XP_006572341.1 IST1 homolog isoform X4 [Apis mellifera]